MSTGSDTARDGIDEVREEPRGSVRTWTAKQVGNEGEILAASYLERRGYEILDRNWRCPEGEVDIVAYDPDERVPVLVEVKTRVELGATESVPEIAVTARKRHRYNRLALLWLAMNPQYCSIRFDVIAIKIVAERTAQLRHLVAAFSWDE